jgi:RNA polymerase sigma factor (TIGR02999 family)
MDASEIPRRMRGDLQALAGACAILEAAGGEEIAMVDAAQPAGSASASLEADALFAQVYDRLKAMAGRRLAMGAHDTLDTTALVHDLYLRVGASQELSFAHPNQFFSYAAHAMRHLLADRARDRMRQRAGGDWMRTTLTGSDYRLAIDSAEQALALDEALQRLEQTDARAAQVVELTCFAGLSQDQVADALGLALRTVARDWRFARAFLKSELG